MHLSYAQQPIIGDALYGGQPAYLSALKKNYNAGRFEEETPMIRRVALHAQEISFLPADSDEPIEVKADYPKDFAVFIKQLRKFS